MGRTWKDNRDIKETIKPAKTGNRKLTYLEKEELKKIREDMHWDRMLKNGFAG